MNNPKHWAVLIVLLLITALVVGRDADVVCAEDAPPGPSVMHSVFFTLKESSPEAKARLVEACKKYLTDHPGTRHFFVGTRAEDFNRSVNDVAFDVALHIVFESRQAHDRYQTAERHLAFIEENRDTWKNVRVFDAYLAP